MKGRFLDDLTKDELLAFTRKHVRKQFLFWWENIRDEGFQEVLAYSAEAGILPEELMGILLILKLFEVNKDAGSLSIYEAWRQARLLLPLQQPVIKHPFIKQQERR